MAISDYFNIDSLSKVALAATLAKESQKQEIRKLILEIGREARKLQVESDLDLVADKYLDKVRELASTLQITGAVGREIWSSFKESYHKPAEQAENGSRPT